VQIGFKEAGKHSVEFVEEWGRLLNLAVFFLFGLVAMRALPQFNLAHRHPVELSQRRLHGLVRPARTGIYRLRLGVPSAGVGVARRDYYPARVSSNSLTQHLCPRAQRITWY